ncbi:MAG: YhfC family intramembrane metalloprotease [Ardenticatenales bacterium]|nr:YhfC family intramembrane metalloprotease [Ardenticatenales bacterium]
MNSIILLTLQAIIVLIGPVLLGWWLQRRFGPHWSSWGWGALAFVASQVARMPFLIGLTLLGQRSGADPDPNLAFWSNLLVLSITAGLFEESARYLVMSRFAKKVRNWREGVMFGAGHGGIEAMLIVGLGVINAIVFLSMGEAAIEQVRATAPEQVDLAVKQLAELRDMAWWLPVIALYERVLAITFHIAASLLVMRAVRRGSFSGTAWPMLYHSLFNAIAVYLSQRSSTAVTYLAMTALVLPAIIIIYTTHLSEETPEIKEEAI